MLKPLSAFAAFAMLAGALIMSPLVSPQVEASAPVPVAKSDRLETTSCDLRGWPYYQASCLRDETQNAGRARAVRIVSTDRIVLSADAEIPATSPFPPAWLASLPGSLPVDEVALALGQ